MKRIVSVSTATPTLLADGIGRFTRIWMWNFFQVEFDQLAV
jgi:hypothetical protein